MEKPMENDHERLLLRPAEAADAIGVSRSQVYALLASGDLPCVRIGTSVLVPIDQLKAWIDQHRVEANDAQPQQGTKP